VRTVLSTPDAPTPVGPYSVAIATESLVFCAAQAGIDPATGRLRDGGIAAETQQALANLAAVLAADGLTFDDVVKANLYLVDMGDWAIVNEIYGGAIGSSPPARTTIGVASLPIGARIEIEMVAVRRASS